MTRLRAGSVAPGPYRQRPVPAVFVSASNPSPRERLTGATHSGIITLPPGLNPLTRASRHGRSEVVMRHVVASALIALFCITTPTLSRAVTAAAPCFSAAEVVSQSATEILLRFEFSPSDQAGPDEACRTEAAVTRYSRNETGGSGSASGVWTARSPFPGRYSVLVRVPDTGALSARIVEILAEGPEGAQDTSVVVGVEAVDISEPAVMRDIRIVRLTFDPLCEGLPEGCWVREVKVSLAVSAAPAMNEKRGRHGFPSPAFERVYQELVINYENRASSPQDAVSATARGVLAAAALSGERDDGPSGRAEASDDRRAVEGARYLIISDDNFVAYADSLLAWKARKGLLPRLVPMSEVGSTQYDIKEYIQTAYDTWDVPPEYILLLGDTDHVPTGGGAFPTDNFYARLDGADFIADVFVGRLPADTELEAATMLAKTLAYDRPWLHSDSGWPMSATFIVREDDDHSDPVYYGNTWFIYDLMEQAGFAPMDTLFTRNATASDVYHSLGQGRGFLNYRGVSGAFWVEPFQVLPWLIDSTWELPIVVSATCLSGAYHGDEAVSEYFLRAGDALEPRGGAAFFGTSTYGAGLDLSLKRGYVDEGFFAEAFGPGRTLGEACLAGRTNMYAHVSDMEEYEGWNLLGDPELSIWTAAPAELTVDFEPIVTVSAETMYVSVELGGSPVHAALVTLEGLPDLFAWALTDSNGNAAVPLDVSDPQELRMIVTAKNATPRAESVLILASGPALYVDSSSVDDSEGGNGDGRISPGESVRLVAALTNLGDSEAGDVRAVLRSDEGYATVVDSVVLFGDIPSGETSQGEGAFRLSVEDDWPGGHPIPLGLSVSYGDSHKVLSLPPVQTVTGDVVVALLVGDDGSPSGNGNGDMEPGEVVGLEVVLNNAAASRLTNIAGTLTSRNPRVEVTSGGAAFPDVDSGQQSSNVRTPFIVSVAPDAPPGNAGLYMRVEADASEYSYAETLALDIDVAEVAPLFPTGPDAYGYYAYDSTDSIYAQAPTFEWTEIGHEGGPGVRIDAVSDADDAVVTLSAPFVMSFYGLNRTVTSICSNGFVSLYQTDYRYGDNLGIPDLDGPPSMLAPLWDDMNTLEGGDVYVWLDPYEHRYIIEYKNVRHDGLAAEETFQIVIYDPDYCDNPTGDSEILFLYKDVGNPGGCTVGIEHPYQTDGLEYLFNGDYGTYAAPLADSLAILFTTSPPETLTFPWLLLTDWRIDDTSGDGDGRPDAGGAFELTLFLENDGACDATDISMSLTCDNTGVEIVGGTFVAPLIPVGGVADNAHDPFVIQISEALADSVITLRLTPGASSNTRQGAIRLDLSAGSVEEPEVHRLSLGPCRPNPFAGGTRLALSLPAEGGVNVKVYDVAGRLVRTLVDGVLPAGERDVVWDGKNAAGDQVASGVYFLRMSFAGKTKTRKAVLLK